MAALLLNRRVFIHNSKCFVIGGVSSYYGLADISTKLMKTD